jgi:tetratricopeptide (TPR) repeat protein
MSAWDLIENEHYSEAVTALSEEAEASPSTLVFNNRGMAYLHLGEFDAALADFRKADALSSSELKTVCSGDMCGVALWISARHHEAVETWAAGVEASLTGVVRYGDAAGGVTIGNLLMFGGVRLGIIDAVKLATSLLRKRLRTKQSRAWPGPVSRYLLGKLDESALLEAVCSTPILHQREMCQARFYVGLRALSRGDHADYYVAMNQAAGFGRVAKLGAEYYLSLHEARNDCSRLV